MRVDFNGNKMLFAVISARRPENVETLQAFVGEEPLWVVADGEYNAYHNAGANYIIEGGELCESRNAAIGVAEELELPLLSLDDDITDCQIAGYSPSKGKFVGEKITFAQSVDILWQSLIDNPNARLAGVAPTNNPFYYTGKRYSTKGFIVGDLFLLTDYSLLFDTKMKLKEDYDYTLQHIQKFGCVARCDNLLVTFRHRTNPGGAVTYRSPEIEEKMITYLVLKWNGRNIRRNPKRQNEIILKF